jgi:CRP/FNR family transcriptional regulator, cyclic AMP receptor protein
MASAQSVRAKYSRSLNTHPLFLSLSETIRRDLDSKLIVNEHCASSVLYRQGEKPEGLYILFSGRVKITSLVSGERTALLKIAEPSEILGMAAMFASRSHIATAQIMSNSRVGLLRHEEILSAMRRHPDFAAAIVRFLASECIETNRETLFLRVPCSSSQRVAAALLRIADENRCSASPNALSIAYTHAELGQLIGASRETVTRIVKTFQRKGIVETKKSAITVADPHLLRKIAGA